MGLFARRWIVLLAACIALEQACTRQTSLPPADATQSETAQKLPFDRQPQPKGLSPSRSLIPSVAHLPEGTPLTVCLQHALSSASARSGDSFAATLDAPITIDGQTLVGRGATVSGRVLEAKHSGAAHDPGYLRLSLVSLTVGEKDLPIQTSSLFAKGGAREERSSAMIGAGPYHKRSAAVGSTGPIANPAAEAPQEILLGPERRLSFRLAQTLDLQ